MVETAVQSERGQHTGEAGRRVEEGIRARLGEIGCSDPEIDAELFTQILQSFLGRTPDEVQHLLHAAAEGDDEAVGRRAHSIRGAASAVGASGLAAACLELENVVDVGDRVPQELCDALQEAFGVTVQAMRAVLISLDRG